MTIHSVFMAKVGIINDIVFYLYLLVYQIDANTLSPTHWAPVASHIAAYTPLEFKSSNNFSLVKPGTLHHNMASLTISDISR